MMFDAVQFGAISKESFAAFCRFLYHRELIVGSSGNVAARLGDRFLVTPTGFSLRAMTPENVLEIDAEGKVLRGPAGERPSKETRMHLEIFSGRPDVQVVCHVHGAYITSVATLLEEGDNTLPPVNPAISYYVYPLAMLPFYIPGTLELAEAVGKAFAGNSRKAVLLRNHGLITVGATLTETLNLAEEVNEGCQIYVLTQGRCVAIPDAIARQIK